MSGEMLRYLRRKWAEIVSGKAHILSEGGVISGGMVLTRRELPYTFKLNSKAPNYEDDWKTSWRWLVPLEGVTFDHPDSSFMHVTVPANTPPGVGRLEIVYTRTSDGMEFHSAPYFIRVFDPSPETLAEV